MVALDLGMPGMDGVELLRFLAEEGYRAPVLIISGFDRRVLERAFRLGQALGLTMAGPLEKPVRLEELEGVAQRAAADAGAMIAKADLGLLDGFERALINHRLHMVYQPKVSLPDGSLVRVEALVRWDDPELGAVPPSRFVPLAERHGLIDPLTQWGLRTTLRQWLKWREQGIDTCIAFNISALSLEQLDFPDLVERMCRALDVPTDRLVLELTEGATQPLVKLMDTLTRFRIKGIGLAIDDFGTGYSSLMQLRQLPFTEVKIDRFFVDDATTSRRISRLIVKSIIDLAHGLGLTVTAEGVETAEQLLAAARARLRRRPGLSRLRPRSSRDELKPWQDEFPRAAGSTTSATARHGAHGRDVEADCPGLEAGRGRN